MSMNSIITSEAYEAIHGIEMFSEDMLLKDHKKPVFLILISSMLLLIHMNADKPSSSFNGKLFTSSQLNFFQVLLFAFSE